MNKRCRVRDHDTKYLRQGLQFRPNMNLEGAGSMTCTTQVRYDLVYCRLMPMGATTTRAWVTPVRLGRRRHTEGHVGIHKERHQTHLLVAISLLVHLISLQS